MKCEILLQLNWYENSPNAGSSPGVHVHSMCFTLTEALESELLRFAPLTAVQTQQNAAISFF
jgi:hypothetical protein